MINLINTHQSIAFAILVLVTALFIRWLFSPVTKKSDIILPPPQKSIQKLQNTPQIFEIRFNFLSFLEPTKILTESNQIGIKYFTYKGDVILLFHVSDIENAFERIKKDGGRIGEYTFFLYLYWDPETTYYCVNFENSAEDAVIAKDDRFICNFFSDHALEDLALENYAEYLSQL